MQQSYDIVWNVDDYGLPVFHDAFIALDYLFTPLNPLVS